MSSSITKRRTSRTVAIVGAGLMGRLIALECSRRGIFVHLFDKTWIDGNGSCAFAAAGMLAPVSELETAEAIIYQLGADCLALWSEIIDRLNQPVFLQQKGTLVVAQRNDIQELRHFQSRIQSKLPNECINACSLIARSQLEELEPELSQSFGTAIFISQEGQIDNRQVLRALGSTLLSRRLYWRKGKVSSVAPGTVIVDGETMRFDTIVDCRGMGARADLSALRAVRGELLEVHAPDVVLHRPVRVLHPRWPVYVVPREHNRFLIGATSIETNDCSNVKVESALELLSAACRLHSGFHTASITEMRTGLRPALPDNLPRIFVEPGLIRVNGLYRHGFLLGPKVAQLVTSLLIEDVVLNRDAQEELIEHLLISPSARFCTV